MVKSQQLPDVPGVYKFIGAKGEILYIGKATSLRNRVKSYFAGDITEKRSPLIAKMIEEARGVKFEKTDSVLEALILEARLIKKHQPPYNTDLKDQKSWNWVVITKEKFPRVLVVRERELKSKARSLKLEAEFGPFTNSGQLKEALKIIRKIFPFRDKCLPAQTSKIGQGAGCFNYQLGLCPGVCAGTSSPKEYRKTINHIKKIFSGQKKQLVKQLEKEMKSLAKAKEFEEASEVKRRIFALQHINDIALIKDPDLEAKSYKLKAFRIEAYDVAHTSGQNMVGVMVTIENGKLKKSDYRMFKIKGQKDADDTKALREVLERRLKHNEWPKPDLIVVDGGKAQLNTSKAVTDIPVVAVTKDEKHKPKKIQNSNFKIQNWVQKYKREILLANSEAHRFALSFHRKLRGKIG